MTVTQGLIMGVVQGLTEFLPVSSSGHLALARHLLGAGVAQDVGFEVAVHAGTLLAVLLFYRARLMRIFTEAWRNEGEGRRWLLYLLVGSVPAGVVGLAAKDHIAALFNSITLVGAAWLFTALILLAADRARRGDVNAERMGVWRSLVIGCGQALALVPGVSRSGTTISAALLTGVERRGAVDFAFLLSLPSVGGATLLTIPEYLQGSVGFGASHVAGMVTAGLSGYFAIAVMLRVVTSGKLGWFALYCAAAGAAALTMGLIS